MELKIGKTNYKAVNMETELTALRYDFAMSSLEDMKGRPEKSGESRVLKSSAMSKVAAALVYSGKDKTFDEDIYKKQLSDIENAYPSDEFIDFRSEIVDRFLTLTGLSRKDSQPSTQKGKAKKS